MDDGWILYIENGWMELLVLFSLELYRSLTRCCGGI